MAKKDYQMPRCIIVAFEKADIVTLSVADGTTFNAQDYDWWAGTTVQGGFVK